MPELTDAQKVMRNNTGQDIAEQIRLLRLQMEGGGLPAGGAAGQIPVKASATDYDVDWQYPQYSRPNLLDNWYFVGGGSQLGYGVFPINQRGQVTYVTQGPCIDRWRMRGNDNGSVAIAPTGDSVAITLNTNTGSGNSYKSLDQILDKEKLQGKTVTLSCLVTGYVNDGADWLALGIWATDNIVIHTDIIRSAYITAPGLVSITVDIPSQVSNTYLKAAVLVKNSAEHTGSVSIKIQAVKLELGSYQTLAHNEGTEENPNWVLNELPDYGQELAKCQRYLRIYRSSSSAARIIGIATAYTTSRLALPIPGSFAAPPTISGDLIVYSPKDGSSGAVPIGAFYIWSKDDSGVYVRLTVESGNTLTSNSLYCAAVPANNTAAFILSCEQ